MKRDLELIRKVLLAIEDLESFYHSEQPNIEGYAEEQISYNSYLLIDAGLAEGHVGNEAGRKIPRVWLGHLTWAGHEFLDASRNDTHWRRVMATLAEKGESVTIGVLQGLLVAAMKTAVGLQ